MNQWAAMLGDLPPSAQRVLARANRISLPRGCAAPLRHTRLRQALCHAATVRATYRALAPAAQAALHQLRTQRGGISPRALTRAYGPVRSWRQLAADPRPQTLSEQLVLLGWLLPRPAAPRHPPRYVLPPELRRWLPRPLTIPSVSAPPLAVAPAPLPLAVRGAVTLLLACAERPLDCTPAGQVTRAALRRLEPRLAPLAPAACAALVAWLVPLLAALDVISRQPGAGTLTLAGQRFLALPADQQRGLLYRAWIAHPDPDAWLDRLLIDRRGIDWPLLRRRLCAWVAALPVGQRSTPAALYPALATTLGPLADAQTHGFRRVDRAPWQPRRAATIFAAAVRGPLYWLGWWIGSRRWIPARRWPTAGPRRMPTSSGYLGRRLRHWTRPPTLLGLRAHWVRQWCRTTRWIRRRVGLAWHQGALPRPPGGMAQRASCSCRIPPVPRRRCGCCPSLIGRARAVPPQPIS